MDCEHLRTHDEIRTITYARFVPSWEREHDDQIEETATVRDRYVICDDCGECVDCVAGD